MLLVLRLLLEHNFLPLLVDLICSLSLGVHSTPLELHDELLLCLLLCPLTLLLVLLYLKPLTLFVDPDLASFYPIIVAVFP